MITFHVVIQHHRHYLIMKLNTAGHCLLSFDWSAMVIASTSSSGRQRPQQFVGESPAQHLPGGEDIAARVTNQVVLTVCPGE